MDYPGKSDAWHEGRMAARSGDHDNFYKLGTPEHEEWQQGHDFQPVALTLEDVSLISAPGAPVQSSPFGWVIGKDGTTYALCNRWYHGVICAILYPELSAAHEVGIPYRNEVNVLKYQHFEHDHSQDMEVIRISVSSMTGATYFSKASTHKATDDQIQAVISCCADLGYTGRKRITTDMGDLTVAQLVDELRKGVD